MADILIGTFLALVVLFVVLKIIQNKRNGRNTGCGGNCAGCSGCGSPELEKELERIKNGAVKNPENDKE